MEKESKLILFLKKHLINFDCLVVPNLKNDNVFLIIFTKKTSPSISFRFYLMM